MGKEENFKITDELMQFATVSVRLDASDASALVDAPLQTGLTVRGDMVWKIHRLDIRMPHTAGVTDYVLAAGLSMRAGLAGVPLTSDPGCIYRWDRQFDIAANGVVYQGWPVVDTFMPALPIAGPTARLYAALDADQAVMRNQLIAVRIGFTTEKMTKAMWQELLDVWGWMA